MIYRMMIVVGIAPRAIVNERYRNKDIIIYHYWLSPKLWEMLGIKSVKT